jgi:hypothetical protein
LPDVAGRRRAASVALIAAALIVSILPAAATSATAPPGINRFLYALGQVESGGNYYARNPYSGAYGKYQILPSNWPVWARLYVGSSTAKWTPRNQETVARGKVTALYRWLDRWDNVAHWWLTGSGDTNKTHWSSYSKYYVAKVMRIYAAVSESKAAADVMAGPIAPAAPTPPPIGSITTPPRHVGELAIGVAYAGRWDDASYRAYAGGRVLYSSSFGSTASYSFDGRSIAWIGPVGPTRGRARVYVDGRAVATVDLRRGSFSPRVTLFKTSWSKAGHHTLTIRVLTSGRPVAIDEFIVRR